MLLITLFACQDEPVEQQVQPQTLQVHAYTYGSAFAMDDMAGAVVAVDDRKGKRLLAETNNAGMASVEVDPADGPFDVTVHGARALPRVYTRMGVMPEDGTAVFAFQLTDVHAAMIDVWGTASPRTNGTFFGVTAHQMDLAGGTEDEGRLPVISRSGPDLNLYVHDAEALDDAYRVSVQQHEPFSLLAYEYTHTNAQRRGEFNQHFQGWYRFDQDARYLHSRVDLALTHPVVPESALGDVYTTETFTGPLAEMHGQVMSRSSAYNTPCGFPTEVTRMSEDDGWSWAMEWVPPIEDEDVATMVWATGHGATTIAMRYGAPHDFPAIEMLPAPRLLGDFISIDEDLAFAEVPANARPVIDVVPTRLPELVLWTIEGPKGAKNMLLPDPVDDDVLPDINLSLRPRLDRRSGIGYEVGYDMAEGVAVDL